MDGHRYVWRRWRGEDSAVRRGGVRHRRALGHQLPGWPGALISSSRSCWPARAVEEGRQRRTCLPIHRRWTAALNMCLATPSGTQPRAPAPPLETENQPRAVWVPVGIRPSPAPRRHPRGPGHEAATPPSSPEGFHDDYGQRSSGARMETWRGTAGGCDTIERILARHVACGSRTSKDHARSRE